MGLARGGRVLMLLDDTPEYVAAIFGALRAGFVPVLVNTLSPPELVAYYLADSGAEVGVRRRALRGAACARGRRRRHACAGRARRRCCAGSPPRSQRCSHEWNAWIGAQEAHLEPADTHRDDMAFWMYSSGSTGRPKGVVHLHHDALYTWSAYGERVLAFGARRRRLLAAQDLLRVRLRQLDHVPVRGRRDHGADDRSSRAGSRVRDDRAPPPDRVLRPADALRGDGRASAARKRATSRACACASRRRRRCRRSSSTNGAGATDSRSSRAWARPRCSTSICPTRRDQQKPGASGKRVPGYELRLTDPDGRDVRGGRVRDPLGARRVAGAVLLAAPRQDGGDDARRLDLHRRPLPLRCRRIPLLRRARRRSREGERAVGASARGRALPRRMRRSCASAPCSRCRTRTGSRRSRLTSRCTTRRSRATRRPAELQRFVKSRLCLTSIRASCVYLAELPKTGTGKIDRQALKRDGLTYSTVAPDSRTTTRHFSYSRCTKSRNCAGEPPTGSAPSLTSCAAIAGTAIASLTRLVDLRDHDLRRSLGREEPEPRAGRKAREAAVGDGRHVGQRARARKARDGDRRAACRRGCAAMTDGIVANMNCTRPGEEVVQRVGALVRHVHRLECPRAAPSRKPDRCEDVPMPVEP